MTTITAGLGRINLADVVKGLTVAVLTPVFTVLINSLEQGNLTFNWKAIGITALTSGLAYLLKNMLTPSKVMISDPVKVQAAKDGETISVTPKP